jgi:hypothetical protein
VTSEELVVVRIPLNLAILLLPMMWNVWRIWNACWVIYHKAIKRKRTIYRMNLMMKFVPN